MNICNRFTVNIYFNINNFHNQNMEQIIINMYININRFQNQDVEQISSQYILQYIQFSQSMCILI